MSKKDGRGPSQLRHSHHKDKIVFRQSLWWEFTYWDNSIFTLKQPTAISQNIWVSKLTNIDSNNGLSPGRLQAIIWTNAGILLIGSFGTNFSEILIEIYALSFKKMLLKMSSGKWRPFCLGLNVFLTGPHSHFTDSTSASMVLQSALVMMS